MSIATIKAHEGFRGMPYDDHLGHPTIGYGTLLPITEEEGELLLQHRYAKMRAELQRALDPLGLSLVGMTQEVDETLMEMAYQLGVPRLMGFKRMWAAIERRAWSTAYTEALDSRWAEQTPARAREVAAGFLRGQA